MEKSMEEFVDIITKLIKATYYYVHDFRYGESVILQIYYHLSEGAVSITFSGPDLRQNIIKIPIDKHSCSCKKQIKIMQEMNKELIYDNEEQAKEKVKELLQKKLDELS